MTIDDLPPFIRDHYEIHEWRHASAVLATDFPDEWRDIITVLTDFRLKKSAVSVGGGNKSPIANELDAAFEARGWVEKQFQTEIVVDDRRRQSPTHKVDYYKNFVGIEMEWNNKDPFYDRDLNNFRLLFDLQAISVGVIITRSDELQEVFDQLGKGKSYGPSTTHMSRLIPRLEGGAGGGCPILVFGISKRLYVEDV
jgi:hypothetical protein